MKNDGVEYQLLNKPSNLVFARSSCPWTTNTLLFVQRRGGDCPGGGWRGFRHLILAHRHRILRDVGRIFLVREDVGRLDEKNKTKNKKTKAKETKTKTKTHNNNTTKQTTDPGLIK